MQLVNIIGPHETINGLLNVKELQLSLHSARDQDEGLRSISGYASDSAIAELRSRRCTVTVVMTEAQVNAAIANGRGSTPLDF